MCPHHMIFMNKGQRAREMRKSTLGRTPDQLWAHNKDKERKHQSPSFQIHGVKRSKWKKPTFFRWFFSCTPQQTSWQTRLGKPWQWGLLTPGWKKAQGWKKETMGMDTQIGVSHAAGTWKCGMTWRWWHVVESLPNDEKTHTFGRIRLIKTWHTAEKGDNNACCVVLPKTEDDGTQNSNSRVLCCVVVVRMVAFPHDNGTHSTMEFRNMDCCQFVQQNNALWDVSVTWKWTTRSIVEKGGKDDLSMTGLSWCGNSWCTIFLLFLRMWEYQRGSDLIQPPENGIRMMRGSGQMVPTAPQQPCCMQQGALNIQSCCRRLAS